MFISRDSSQIEVSKKEFTINLSSCSVGSYVLVVWNSAHNHYVIMQVSEDCEERKESF